MSSKKDKQIPLEYQELPAEEMFQRGADFLQLMKRRRSVRHFSDKPVPKEFVEKAIQTAGSAPSGANRQPWHFVALNAPDIKRQIRVAAEKEEYEFYQGVRRKQEWLDALSSIGTDWQKPYLEIVPWIVVVFEERHQQDKEGNTQKNYYTRESVGIACGLFIAALHNMGLCTLTHTPAPMTFLSEICKRPQNEKPYILFPVGYPADDATVPELKRKSIDEISTWYI